MTMTSLMSNSIAYCNRTIGY